MVGRTAPGEPQRMKSLIPQRPGQARWLDMRLSRTDAKVATTASWAGLLRCKASRRTNRVAVGFSSLATRRDRCGSRRFPQDVILQAGRRSCRYPLSCRGTRDMLAERGITVEAAAVYRRVQKISPVVCKRAWGLHRRWRGLTWPMDELYRPVKSLVLWRAVDRHGRRIVLRLCPLRKLDLEGLALGKPFERGDPGFVPGHQFESVENRLSWVTAHLKPMPSPPQPPPVATFFVTPANTSSAEGVGQSK